MDSAQVQMPTFQPAPPRGWRLPSRSHKDSSWWYFNPLCLWRQRQLIANLDHGRQLISIRSACGAETLVGVVQYPHKQFQPTPPVRAKPKAKRNPSKPSYSKLGAGRKQRPLTGPCHYNRR